MPDLDCVTNTAPFDYGSEAELYCAKVGRKSRRQQLDYRRFARAAEAIRFAIEDLPTNLSVSTYLEVGGGRYKHNDIRRLYDSADYPLERRVLSPTMEDDDGIGAQDQDHGARSRAANA
jgi:hypothetical protein